MNTWQHIGTAPKDGTKVMLYNPMGYERTRITIGWFYEDKYAKRPRPYWTNDSERLHGIRYTRENQPTHWMPLPTPPSN